MAILKGFLIAIVLCVLKESLRYAPKLVHDIITALLASILIGFTWFFFYTFYTYYFVL